MIANLGSLFGTLGPLFLIILVGAFFRWTRILPADAAPLIARVVMTLTLPALVFTAIHSAGTQNIPFSLDLLKMPLLAYAVMAVCGVLAWLISGRLDLSRPQKGAF